MDYQNYGQQCNAKWVHASYRTPSLYTRQRPSPRCASQMPEQNRSQKFNFPSPKNPFLNSIQTPIQQEKSQNKERELTPMAMSTASFCISCNMSALLMMTRLPVGVVTFEEGFRSSELGFADRAPATLLFASSLILFVVFVSASLAKASVFGSDLVINQSFAWKSRTKLVLFCSGKKNNALLSASL